VLSGALPGLQRVLGGALPGLQLAPVEHPLRLALGAGQPAERDEFDIETQPDLDPQLPGQLIRQARAVVGLDPVTVSRPEA
jgi:hypothetical protein